MTQMIVIRLAQKAPSAQQNQALDTCGKEENRKKTTPPRQDRNQPLKNILQEQ